MAEDFDLPPVAQAGLPPMAARRPPPWCTIIVPKWAHKCLAQPACGKDRGGDQVHVQRPRKSPAEPGFCFLVVMVMLRHLLERFLGPVGHRMHLAAFIAHDVEIAGWDGNWLGA